MRIPANVNLIISFLFSTISLAQKPIEKLTTSINGTIINSETNVSLWSLQKTENTGALMKY